LVDAAVVDVVLDAPVIDVLGAAVADALDTPVVVVLVAAVADVLDAAAAGGWGSGTCVAEG
jgi:hypothetical protein